MWRKTTQKKQKEETRTKQRKQKKGILRVVCKLYMMLKIPTHFRNKCSGHIHSY